VVRVRALSGSNRSLAARQVLSLGTGRIAQYVEGDDLDWGIMQWARKLPDMIFGGAVWNAALLCRMQLGKSFHRLDPILEKPIPMDDPTQMAESNVSHAHAHAHLRSRVMVSGC
jgi:hypothetical protein